MSEFVDRAVDSNVSLATVSTNMCLQDLIRSMHRAGA